MALLLKLNDDSGGKVRTGILLEQVCFQGLENVKRYYKTVFKWKCFNCRFAKELKLAQTLLVVGLYINKIVDRVLT